MKPDRSADSVPDKIDKDNDAAKKALQRLESAVNEMVKESGLSEEEMVNLFALKRD